MDRPAAGRLAGKRCVVTAAARVLAGRDWCFVLETGIGKVTAEAFLREGASVIAVDIDAEGLKAFPSVSERLERRVLDVTDAGSVEALASEYSDVDVLFNCVGIVPRKRLQDTTEQEWDSVFDINVKSMYLLCKAFLPQMTGRGSGSIINMSSVAGPVRSYDGLCVYGASKAAVVGLTKGLAKEHVRQGIRCNAVCPSPVAAEGGDTARNDAAFTDSDRELLHYIRNKCAGRLAKAAEVASLCVYLASDESSYQTGGVYVIDGGFTL